MLDDVTPTRAEVEARRPYPWVYRPRFGTKMLFVVPTLAGCGILCLGAAAGVLRPDLSWLSWPNLGIAVLLGLLAVGMLVTLTSVLTYTVVFSADEVRRRGLSGWRAMHRSDIAGFRMAQWDAGGFPRLVLTSKQAGAAALTLVLYRTDDDLDAWFEGLPNEDAAFIHNTLARSERAGWLGRSREARPVNLIRLSLWSTRATFAVFFAGIALFAAPVMVPRVAILPELVLAALAVFAAIPLIAIVAAALSGNLVRLAPTGRPDVRPLITGLLIMPSLILIGFALDLVQLLDWRPALAGGAVIGAVLLVPIFFVDRRGLANPIVPLAMWIAMTAYGYAVLTLTDVELDTAKPKVAVGRVVAKIHHRDNRTVRITFPGDRLAVRDISRISARAYSRIQAGEPACVRIYPGSLGLAWFRVYRCVSR